MRRVLSLAHQEIRAVIAFVFREADKPRGLAVTLLLAGAVFAVPAGPSHLDPFSAIWVFAALAAMAVTILALVFAVIIFRGQFLSSRLPPEVTGELLRPRWHNASCIRLGLVASTALMVMTLIRDSSVPASSLPVLVFDVGILAFTIVRLQRSIGAVFSTRFPRMVGAAVSRLEATSGPVIVERTVLQCLREGDLATAHVVLNQYRGRVEDRVKRDPDTAREILQDPSKLIPVVARKALAIDERTVRFCFDCLESLLMQCLELRRPWHDRIELMGALRAIRSAAARTGDEGLASTGLSALVRAYAAALKLAPPEERLWMLQDDREAAVKTADSDSDLEWEHVGHDWLYEIARDLDLAVGLDQAEFFWSGHSALHSLAYAILAADNLGPKQKRYLLRWILVNAQMATTRAMRAGRSEAFCRWEFEGLFVLAVEKSNLVDLLPELVESMGAVVLAAARAKRLRWIVLNELGAMGRGFAKKEKDELAIMVVEVFEALAEPLDVEGNMELVERYLEAAAGLRSIAECDSRETSEIKTRVESAMKKYGRKDQVLGRWKDALPSRHHIDPRQEQAGPWA